MRPGDRIRVGTLLELGEPLVGDVLLTPGAEGVVIAIIVGPGDRLDACEVQINHDDVTGRFVYLPEELQVIQTGTGL